MSDQEADFVDYLDSLQRKEKAAARLAQAAQLKREWRETTWAGYLIATVESLGIAPFFEAIGNSFERGEDSASFYAVSFLYKIGIIASCILGVYVVGGVLRMIMGEEIVVEQEVVIVEEVTRAQAAALDRAERERKKQEEEGGGALRRRGKRNEQ